MRKLRGRLRCNLRTRFFLFFAGLGIAVSLIVGFIIYHQYSNYIEQTYMDTMEKVSRVLEVRYPVLADPDYLEQEGLADSEEYWAVQRAMQNLAAAFNIDIILTRRVDGQLQPLVDAKSNDPNRYNVPWVLAQRYVESYIDPHIPLVYETKTMQLSKKPYTNEYGTAVSGFRPIIKDGEVVSVLELDYDISFVKHLHWRAQKALLLSLGFAVALAGIFALVLSGTLTRPINELANHARRIGSGDLACKIAVKGNDEIVELGTVLNKMTNDITDYIHNLKQVTAEKERINIELNVASDIQNGMLPHVFPAFSCNPQFSLFAKMQPAKSVGGDFYDFFYLDPEKTKIVFVIADVSGKGVPAALFMTIARTLIKQQMMHTGDPAAVLEQVNGILCEDNPECMFVTIFICRLDLVSGQMLYANGGHNPPLLSKENQPYYFMHLEKGLPLGVFETSKYKPCSLQLNPGDKLYLYTDGINEALNDQIEQFGNERFLETANKFRDLPPEQFDTAIRKAVTLFSGDAEQSDDITTLAIRYTGNSGEASSFEKEITLSADTAELTGLLDWLEANLEAHECHGDICNQIAVVTEEIFVNIAAYAYLGNIGDDAPNRYVVVRFRFEARIVAMQFEDSGVAFNLLEQEMPDTTVGLEDRKIGGLGIFLARKWMDEITYQRKNEKNILTLYKNVYQMK